MIPCTATAPLLRRTLHPQVLTGTRIVIAWLSGFCAGIALVGTIIGAP